MKKFNYSKNFYLSEKIKYPEQLNDIKNFTKKKYVTIGNLRSYNDAAIGNNPISIKKFNKIIEINNEFIEVECGVTIKEVLKELSKKKLFIYGLPGTKYATIGGILANNTLGKSIQNPYLKESVLSFKLLNNGNTIECSKKKNNQIFNLTLGGKGVTGIIISARIKVYSIKNEDIEIEKIFFKSPLELKSIFSKKNIKNVDYITGWVDTTNLNFPGILFKGKHIVSDNTKYKLQDFVLPKIAILLLQLISSSYMFVKLFNSLFLLKNKLSKIEVKHYLNFYFVQDSIINWNKVFKKGFFQYQIEINENQFETVIKKLQEIFKIENFYSQFMIIKFIYSNGNLAKIIISLDFTINNNFHKIKNKLLEFTKNENLRISLSKDSICDENHMSLMNNSLISDANYNQFHCKNFNSNLLKRFEIK